MLHRAHFPKSIVPLFLLVALTSHAQPAPENLSTVHDGRWSVYLSCPDINHAKGNARGYTYNFPVQVTGGRLAGRFDERVPPAFIHFTGRVLADGTLLIDADGLSGSPESTVGQIPRGTPYRYTMKGKLDADKGRADRVELRPCTAEFARQTSQ
jgi:hypothetical protein